jgi:hypothetical protein
VELTSPSGDHMTLVINVEKGVRPGAVAPGPAGIQPTPPAPVGRGRATVAPHPAPTPNDIKEKIERLREEARKRRQRQ